MPRYYTGKGDDGKTFTLAGKRISKDNLQIEANGSLDELQASIGIARSISAKKYAEINSILRKIQEDLFVIGNEISCAGNGKSGVFLNNENVKWLEEKIDEISQKIPGLNNFILPGGSPASAAIHMSRTIARRAERVAVTLKNSDGGKDLDENVIRYMNRLSSLLFVLARYAGKLDGIEEEKWKEGCHGF